MDRRSFIKGTGSSLVVLGTTVHPAAAHSATVSPNVRLTWFGGATMQITFNGMTLLTDPCFGDGEEAFTMGDPNEMFDLAKGPNIKAHRRVTSFPRGKLKPTDLVVLSHAHEDHFDQTAAAELNPDMPFLLPPNDQKKIAGMGFRNLDTVDWSEKRTFQAGEGKIELTALPAAHSESPEIARILGKGNRYWITFSQKKKKKSLYWTGDT
ncbi:MAG: MBL fold metallo-hydrolase, partial [Sneathiellales bacterium]|nr:MBL fold metallo-hydrolase [Sneathiellales bacterium]